MLQWGRKRPETFDAVCHAIILDGVRGRSEDPYQPQLSNQSSSETDGAPDAETSPDVMTLLDTMYDPGPPLDVVKADPEQNSETLKSKPEPCIM